MTNEFEEIDTSEEVPAQEFSDVPPGTEQEDMIATGAMGTEYDYNKAPDVGKAPPRIDLNGKEVTIKKASIMLPPKDRNWERSRKGDIEYKFCTFALHYDIEGQVEFYSGVRVFKRNEGGVEKYSHPSIMRDRKNQASKLLGLYADYKKKDINEVSLKEFMSFLNGQPKAVIKTEEFENPVTEQKITKNIVEKFLSQ